MGAGTKSSLRLGNRRIQLRRQQPSFTLRTLHAWRIGMAPQAPHALQQHVGRGKAAN